MNRGKLGESAPRLLSYNAAPRTQNAIWSALEHGKTAVLAFCGGFRGPDGDEFHFWLHRATALLPGADSHSPNWD
jgi:hypothetical protein